MKQNHQNKNNMITPSQAKQNVSNFNQNKINIENHLKSIDDAITMYSNAGANKVSITLENINSKDVNTIIYKLIAIGYQTRHKGLEGTLSDYILTIIW